MKPFRVHDKADKADNRVFGHCVAVLLDTVADREGVALAIVVWDDGAITTEDLRGIVAAKLGELLSA